MIGRILRIEINRSAALSIAAGTALLGAALLYFTVDSWGGRWMVLAMWQREYLFILWPMALGLGAWHAGRDRRCRTEELISTTARPRWQRALPAAGAMALSAAIGYLLMYAAGVAQVAVFASYRPGQSLVIAGVGVLWMVSGAWLGMAVGAVVPSRLTPAITAVVGATVALVATTDRGYSHVPTFVHLLTPAPFGFWGDFVTVSGRVSVAHSVWLVGLAVTGLFGFVCATRATRLVALVPAAVAAVAALAILPADQRRMPVPDPQAAALVCSSDAGAEVCVTRVHASALADLREPARQALATLSDKLPQAPTSVSETPSSWYETSPGPQPRDTLLIHFESGPWGGVQATPEELRWQLLDGAGTRPCAYIVGRPGVARSHHIARLVAAAWLIGGPPQADGYGEVALRAWETLRSLPATEQVARVAALRESALVCAEVDLLEVLVGGTR